MNNEKSPRFERVMIVDDNPINLYIASRIITKNNFGKQVLQYPTSIEALKYLQENQENISHLPEVIFVDIHMPIMSGFEFMKEYNSLSTQLKNFCNVFIFSSSIDPQDLICAKNDINIVAIKGKPITRELLNDLKIS